MLNKKSSKIDDLSTLEIELIVLNISRIYDIMINVILDKTEDGNQTGFCQLAVDYLSKIKKISKIEYNDIIAPYRKDLDFFISELEVDKDYKKAENLKRFKALLSNKMKWVIDDNLENSRKQP